MIAIASAIWLAYEYRRHRTDENSSGSVGSLVFSSAFVSFLLGILIAVRATGSLPVVIQSYGGDPQGGTCLAQVDTSRLIGLAEDDRLVLLCGAQDPTKDAYDDPRIAISSGFRLNGGPITIVTPLGEIKEVWKDIPKPTGAQGVTFQMWHTVAAIPAAVDPATIKRVSDIPKFGGRILTDPVGGVASPMAAPFPTIDISNKPKS